MCWDRGQETHSHRSANVAKRHKGSREWGRESCDARITEEVASERQARRIGQSKYPDKFSIQPNPSLNGGGKLPWTDHSTINVINLLCVQIRPIADKR